MEMTNNPVEGTGTSVEDTAANIEKILDSSVGTTEKVDADNDDNEFVDLDTVEDDDYILEDDQPVTESNQEAVAEADAVDSKDETQEADAKAAHEAEIVFEVDGKPVSRKEANLGYLRQSDYTKKTQELKQNLARYQVQQKEISQIRAENLQVVEQLVLQMRKAADLADAPSEQLLKDDPHEYLMQKQKFERQQGAIKHLFDQHVGLLEEQARSQKEQLAIDQVAARDQLNEWLPEFADDKTGDGLLIEVGKFMIERGYTADEINSIRDARNFRDMYEFMQLKRKAQHVPEVVKHFEKKPPLTQPGHSSKTTSKTSSDVSARILQKQKQTGSLADTQDWILAKMMGK